MAPVTFHILTVSSEPAFLSCLQSLPKEEASRPLFFGRAQHWVHAPNLSLPSLTGSGSTVPIWTHVLITTASPSNPLSLPSSLSPLASSKWSITAEAGDDMLSAYPSSQACRKSTPPPTLPAGWSAADHSALDAAVPASGIEFALDSASIPLGAAKQPANAQTVKDFARAFGSTYDGPVAMLNLLAYLPGQRHRYFQYVTEFGASVGARYNSEAMLLGLGPAEWSSRAEEGAEKAAAEKGGSGVWEDVGVVWYPSIWHFVKMLDDPDYVDVDRRCKKGVLADNPILCCVEVDWEADGK